MHFDQAHGLSKRDSLSSDIEAVQALLGEDSGRLLQLEHVDHVVVAAAGIVGLRLDPQAPGFDDVDRRARPRFVARFGGVECGGVGLDGPAQCLHP